MWEKMSNASVLRDSAARQTTGGSQTVFAGLLTSYIPVIHKTVGDSGFVHPGIGLTKELLDNIQKQVRGGTEPWSTYFKDMTMSPAAEKEICVYLTDPAEVHYNSQKVNGWFIKDSLTAYTQAVLYFVTGDNKYRRNAVNIFRTWSGLDPERFVYFTDACIHVGIPMNRMCMAAEIIRYSSWQVTEGYSESELRWTKEEQLCFAKHLVRPAVNTFMSSCDEFMNQHLYTVIGAMSGYLFMDDVDGYAKTVEWFTVNRAGKNPGFNGSITRLFRRITTADRVGDAEGSGVPLSSPVIQHVEMGRDQAHGCGDLTNAAIIARLMMGQKTKVDPVEGTISNADDAVGVYEFLDDRILKAADYFLQYMLGYDVDWVPVPFSIRDGKIADNYESCSPAYRGRYNTMNFWDLYVYYANYRPEVNLAEQYPYFYEGYQKKVPSNYYRNGMLVINWDNADGGGDFWMFIPPEMAGDASLLAKPQKDFLVEVEDRGVMVENKQAMFTMKEEQTGFIRFVKSSNESRLAITTGGTDKETIAIRIRTDGIARLTVDNGGEGSIYLPDTCNKWVYVTFTADKGSFGDLYYIILSGLEGNYVDIDAIDIKPETANDSRDPITIVNFRDGNRDLSRITYVNSATKIHFFAETTGKQRVSYKGIRLPEGASLDEQTGVFWWKPDRIGRYSFYVEARSDNTCIVKKIELEVAGSRKAAIQSIERKYDKNTEYTKATRDCFQSNLEKSLNMETEAAAELFMDQLERLEKAAVELKLVSPRLKSDIFTDGNSLDFPQMVYDSTLGKEIVFLTDGTGTFCSYHTAVKGAHILDFGVDLQISVTRFGFRARPGFSDRLAGVQVFGSNDKIRWKQLTAGEAAFTQKYQEVEVKAEEKINRYRYLKLCKTTEYPDALRGDIHCLLEFSDLRIYGSGYEREGKGD